MLPDDDDKTYLGGVPAPPKLPGSPPKQKPVDAGDDQTQFASPPPALKVPGAAPAGPPVIRPPASTSAAENDHTQFAATPPPPAALRLPATPTPRPVASPPPAAPPADAEMTVIRVASPEDATVIIADRARSMVRLQRVQPPGRSEMIALERSTYLLGRSPTSDVELFTPTASREHARLVYRDGQWYVQPFEQHLVLVDGRAVRHEARVINRMRLQLGDDELVFLDGSAPKAGEQATGNRTWWLAALGAAGVLVAVAAWLLFARGR